MASTILRPPADALAAILDGLNLTPVTKGHTWAPASLTGSGPWGVVELPGFERHEPEEAEDEMGTDTWHIEYPVTLYVPLSDAPRDQERMAELVESFVRAVDADHTLGGVCREAVVAEAERPTFTEDRNRVLIVCETTVAVLKYVVSV